MICYRDRSYCDTPCANTRCEIKATEKVFEEASKFGLPVSLINRGDSCKAYIPLEEKKCPTEPSNS